MSGTIYSSPRRPGSGRRPSAERSPAAPPRFQSLARIANQNTRERSEERQLEGKMEDRSSSVKMRWSGDKLRYEDNLDCEEHDQHPPFFVPSYLRGNRHMEKLKRNWEMHIAELEERRDAREGHAGSRKMSGSYRGVAHDIVERAPAGLLSSAHSVAGDDVKSSRGLPSRWSEDDKWVDLEVVGDGSEVRFSGVCKTTDEAASIRTDLPMPQEFGLYYYEVTILSRCKEGLIGIGFSGRNTALNRLPGWETDSWAYHGDDGFSFNCSANGKQYGPKFVTLDVIGCGVNFRTGTAFFTKNGIHLGTAFTHLKATQLFPSIGIKKSGEHIRANFGRDKFVFDIDGMMAEERRLIRDQINKTDVSLLHPPDDESTLIQKLVAQYLAHEGYVETSKAFASDVQDRAKSLSKPGSGSEPTLFGAEDDVHTVNRQKIRKAILAGDIDKAIKFTQTFYPQVLLDDRNKDIYFQLRCRKFVEMMIRYSELQVAATPSTVSNGHTTDDALDNQMELDDQLDREFTKQSQLQQLEGDMDMESSTSSLHKSGLMKSNDYLTAALQYGQELHAEFGGDPRPAVKDQLREVFAIMAYVDPRESIVGSLLDKRGRVGIAERVNGAILVSLGKPSSAALEKLCNQTEAFLDAVAGKVGGKAGMVNVREDFLRPQSDGPGWTG